MQNPHNIAPIETDNEQLQKTALSQRGDEVIAGLKKATEAAFALLEELTKARREGDEWTRLPSADGGRCTVSHWSRSKIKHLIAQEKVRGKSVEGSSYYSMSDVRSLINFLASQN